MPQRRHREPSILAKIGLRKQPRSTVREWSIPPNAVAGSAARCTRSRSARCARVWPGYCSAITRSKSRAATSNSASSGSRSVTSTRSPGCSVRSSVSACGTMAWAADWNTAIRTVPPTTVSERATSASASSSRSSTARAWLTSTSACGVSCTRRPTCTSSGTPASFSSWLSCCDTDDGLYDSASATAASVPRWLSSTSSRRRRTSSMGGLRG